MEGTISNLIPLMHSFQPPVSQHIYGGICTNNILYFMIRKCVLHAVCLMKLTPICINLLLTVVFMLTVHPSLPKLLYKCHAVQILIFLWCTDD
jgi:hypothetical protein